MRSVTSFLSFVCFFTSIMALVPNTRGRRMNHISAKKGGGGGGTSGMMPTPDELAALNKVLDGEIEWGDLEDWANPGAYDVPDIAINMPLSAKKTGDAAKNTSLGGEKLAGRSTSWKRPARRATPLKKPNSDWRNSASRKAVNAPRPEDFIEDFEIVEEEGISTMPQRVRNNAGAQGNGVDSMYTTDSYSIDDLGYGDFERAFAELSQGGLNPGGGGSKRSKLVEAHPGLVSGQVIKGGVWPNLIQPDGETTRFSRIHKDQADVVVLYAAPRRYNDEMKTIMSEFSKLPMNKMKLSGVVVNTDDANDHRKLVKKMNAGDSLPFSLLSDPTGLLMEALCCKMPGRTVSCLMILEVNKGLSGSGAGVNAQNADATILRVMYQGAWDPLATKDVVVEEVEEYRKNPTAYLQRQIGIM